MNKPQVRISAIVPEPILNALSRVHGKYSSIEHVFHCIPINDQAWVGVAGDGDNGGYEHFVFRDGNLTISDVGYGCTEIALRDVLNQEFQP